MHVAALVLLACFASAMPAGDPLALQPSHETAKKNAHHIFNEIHSAARQWGSSLNHNGMGFIPAVVPKGTLLHHGTHSKEVPNHLEWLAFEVEHAENFARSWRRRNPEDGDDHREPPPPPSMERGRGFPHKNQARRDPENGHDHRRGEGENQEPLGREPHPPPSMERWRGFPQKSKATHDPKDGDDHDDPHRPRPPPFQQGRGFLHTYQARRDLNLLYLDGSAAAKTSMGTLDTQDYVLREHATSNGPLDERSRALELCNLTTSWGYDGVIRMEIGFEVIHCNFTDSLDLVSLTRTVVQEDKMTDNGLAMYQWARAASQRYDGIGAGRIKLDYSSMVSGFFYPINISSQTPDRPDLVRFASAKTEERGVVRETIKDVAAQPRRYTVDWQAVVDQVVTRFADRFSMLAAEDGVTDEMFRDELEGLALTYYDAPPLPADEDAIALQDGYDGREKEATERCSKHFLLPALVFKEEFSLWDDLIHTAVAEVTHTICETTVKTWVHLNQTISTPDISDGEEKFVQSHELRRRGDVTTLRDAVHEARSVIQALMDELSWSIWKKTRPCPSNALLYVAMWPFGQEEDHWDPGCRTAEDLMRRDNGRGYWGDFRM